MATGWNRCGTCRSDRRGNGGAACAEWHLHAWDLAKALGKDYQPAEPEVILAGWRAGVPQADADEAGEDEGSGDPWRSLLRASGRDPDWST